MAIVAVMMCVNFAACSDDDEEDTPNNPLIGTWQEDGLGESGSDDITDYIEWTFKTDGTGTERNFYRGEWEDTYPFKYSYDSKTSILVVNYGEYNGEDEIDSYDVTINGNTMTTKDRDYGYETTWKKTK